MWTNRGKNRQAFRLKILNFSVLSVLMLMAMIGTTGVSRAQDADTEGAEGAAETEAASATEDVEEGEAEPVPEKEPRTVNLIIQGTEADKWNLDVGGGWNEGDGLYGRLALSSTNFLGRGEFFAATLEAGAEHELYEVEYRRPFVFGQRQSLGIRLFHDYTERPVAGGAEFNQRRNGGALTYGRRFGRHQSFHLEYRYADVDQEELAIVGGDALLVQETSFTSSSLRPAWIFDSLDHRLSPFRGLRVAAAMELAGGALGGDSELIKSTLGLTWFQPLRQRGRPRATFSLRTRLGALEARNDSQLFAQQRFFAGGQDSVRGFRRDSIAVVGDDGSLALDDNGLPLGGERLAQFNLETHLLFGDRFRLVFFADAGGVFAPGQSLDSESLRTSAGAELRVNLPRLNLPLRLIYARNLDPLPEDRFRDFSFSVGVTF